MKDAWWFLWLTDEEAGSGITSFDLCLNPSRLVLL